MSSATQERITTLCHEKRDLETTLVELVQSIAGIKRALDSPEVQHLKAEKAELSQSVCALQEALNAQLQQTATERSRAEELSQTLQDTESKSRRYLEEAETYKVGALRALVGRMD